MGDPIEELFAPVMDDPTDEELARFDVQEAPLTWRNVKED